MSSLRHGPKPSPLSLRLTTRWCPKMRCHLLAQRNLIDVLYPGELSPQTLAERLVLALGRDDYPSHEGVVETHGVHAVAALLLKLAGARA